LTEIPTRIHEVLVGGISLIVSNWKDSTDELELGALNPKFEVDPASAGEFERRLPR
jgi:hypothetical protein